MLRSSRLIIVFVCLLRDWIETLSIVYSIAIVLWRHPSNRIRRFFWIESETQKIRILLFSFSFDEVLKLVDLGHTEITDQTTRVVRTYNIKKMTIDSFFCSLFYPARDFISIESSHIAIVFVNISIKITPFILMSI